MKRRSIFAVVATALLLSFSAAAPTLSTVAVPGVGIEQAQAQKKGKGGGGANKLSKSGEKGADLISGIVGPLMIALIGVICLVALIQRQVGMAVGAAAVGVLSGFFTFAPSSVESVIKGFWNTLVGVIGGPGLM